MFLLGFSAADSQRQKFICATLIPNQTDLNISGLLSGNRVQANLPKKVPERSAVFSVAVVLTEYILSLSCKVDIEMDGKMLNSHGVDFLDGPLGLDLDEKDLDEEETRRDMAKILKELKQKHPDKEVCDHVRSDKTCCQ